MKHKHMFSLLDQSFTTVHVRFDSAKPTKRVMHSIAVPPQPTWSDPDTDTPNGRD